MNKASTAFKSSENVPSAPVEEDEILRLRTEQQQLREQIAALTDKLTKQDAIGGNPGAAGKKSGPGKPAEASKGRKRRVAKAQSHPSAVEHLMQKVESGISNNPVTAMAVTFGVGFALARMLKLGDRS